MTTEELEAQNAELRSVLTLVRQRLRQEFMDDREVMPKIEHALSGECGVDCVPREELERMTKERDEWWQNCERLVQEHNAKVAELERVQAQCAEMRHAYDELCQVACEFIGPDEDNRPECTCCGMSLETTSKGHKRDCLAHAILDTYANDFKPDAGRGWASPEDAKMLVEALKKAYYELNTIRAHGGVPWTHMHMWSDVNAGYFSSVVYECGKALAHAREKGLA